MVSLRIALRYLFSKKTHSVVNVISLISLAGVSVATIAIVCVLSVFNGFTDLASSHLSLLDPDLKITPRDGKIINNADSIVGIINNIDGVEKSISTIEEQALAIYDTRQMPIMIKGVPESFGSITKIQSTIIDGDFLSHDSLADYATLSVGVAVNLQAFPQKNEYIGIHLPQRSGRINPANPMTAFRSDSLIVGGVFQLEQAEYDTDMIIIPLENARQLLDYETEASAIEIKLVPTASASIVTEAIQKHIGKEYLIRDHFQQQEQSFRMIEIEKWITFLMLAFILIIASFNIISTLSLLVIEKQDNITTLHHLGATQKMISRIFMLEGWLISIIGGIAGIVIGAILTLAQQWGGFIKLNGDPSAMSIDTYPVRLDISDLFIVLGLVIIIGFFTSQVTAIFTRNKVAK